MFGLGRLGSLGGVVETPTPEAPVIVVQPANVSVVEGLTAQFSVAATGSPIPTYQWQEGDGTPLPGATSATYTILVTEPSDDGLTFKAVATNSEGSDTSDTASLTVATADYRAATGVTILGGKT